MPNFLSTSLFIPKNQLPNRLREKVSPPAAGVSAPSVKSAKSAV
jgi:hypothetical protein